MSHPVCVALDFETAGRYSHSACALGMARLENLEVTEQFYTLIRPPSSRVYFTNIHGLRWSDLKNQRAFGEIWPEALEFIKGADYLIAHNASFDRGVLAGCCREFGQLFPQQPFLCTLKGTRAAIKSGSHSLGVMCDYFHIELQHHHAASDARGCALLYVELKKMGMAEERMLLA